MEDGINVGVEYSEPYTQTYFPGTSQDEELCESALSLLDLAFHILTTAPPLLPLHFQHKGNTPVVLIFIGVECLLFLILSIDPHDLHLGGDSDCQSLPLCHLI